MPVTWNRPRHGSRASARPSSRSDEPVVALEYCGYIVSVTTREMPSRAIAASASSVVGCQ